jgi:hypothetical protein
VPKAATDQHRIVGAKALGGGKGDRPEIPFARVHGVHFLGLGVDQSTVMRVASAVPLTSARGVPTPTASKLGGQSFQSKVPV